MTKTSPASQSSAAPVAFEGTCPDRARPLVLAACIVASAMGFIDGTVVSIALPAMRESLGASLPQAQWFSNAYMLFLSALILAGGAVGDKLGQARVFKWGIAAFVVASLACAFAPSPEFMIAARAAKGMAAAFMVPGSLALISRTYPRAERGRAIGIWAAASALTTAAGPIIGGIVLTAGGPEMWRWIFAVNLPLGLLALGLLARAITRDPAADETPLDWQGALLATAALAALAWGLTILQTGVALPYLLGALAFGAAFLWHEARSPHPMMPLTLFRSPVFAAANAATFLLYMSLAAIMFFLPMTVITTWGVSEIEAAAAFAPLSVFISTLSSWVGRLADRHGPARIIAAGAGIVALSYAALAATAPLQNFWFAVMPAMVVTGFGMALVVAPLSTAVMTAVEDSQNGIASGINNALSRMASLVAIAAFGSVAAIAYGAAGGPASFGEDMGGALHAAATTMGFVWTAALSSALAAGSAAIMWYSRG
ncbi:MAG: MFS transporter [Pseudomonadota bacterium]